MPQADRLENIRQLVAAAKEGIQHPAALRELLGVDERHFAYYRRAAIILGLLADRDDGSLSITETGRALLGTKEKSVEERAALFQAITESRALKQFRSFFEGDKLSLQHLAARLEQLTGLSSATAERRARTLIRWRDYIQSTSSTPSGPDLPNLTPKLASLIATHNALAKQKFLDWLQHIAPSAFEDVVAHLVEALNHRDVQITGGTGDGGVDVRAIRVDQWNHAAPVAVQVKRYTKPIARKTVDELLGTIVRERYVAGILITTSDFSKDARKVAATSPQIQLVDGAQLVDLLASRGVGIAYGHYGELILAVGD